MKYEFFALFCVLAMVLATGQTSGAAASLYDQVDFRADPLFDATASVQNIGNESQHLDTTISEWSTDLGTMMPNGTYQGTYLSGSKFHNYFKPTWEETILNRTEYGKTITYVDDGRYSYALISAHFNWSTQTLMNGASEWWVRLPVSPQSIEVSHGIVMAVFKNMGTNASDVYLEPSYKSNNTLMRPSIRGYVPQDFITYSFDTTGRGRGEPIYNPFLFFSGESVPFTSGVGRMNNDRIYLKVNSILRPDADYIIAVAFRMPRSLEQTGGLYTYWSGSSTVSNWSHMQFYEFALHGSLSNFYAVWDVTELGNETMDMPMDMDWSFIFTEGIGADGLFGKRLTFDSNATLTLYPFFNTSLQGAQYMSFMLPFISGANVTVEPNIRQGCGGVRGVGPVYSNHVWLFDSYTDPITHAFIPASYIFDPDIWYNYTDFILFSSSSPVNFTDPNFGFRSEDRWNVRVDLNFAGSGHGLNATRHYDVTLLCYERIRLATLWSTIRENSSFSTVCWNSSSYPWARPFLQSHTLNATSSVTETFDYDVFCSGRGTDGQWAMQVGTVSGLPVYTFHFPQIIFINPQQWRLNKAAAEAVVDLSQKDGYYNQLNDWFGEHYFGEILRYKFYDPAQKWTDRIGWISDRISMLVNAFLAFGNWVKTVLLAFIGQVIKFLKEMYDAIAGIVMAIRWLFAPLVFMGLVSYGAKNIRKMLTGGVEE